MKTITYDKAHSIDQFSLQIRDLPMPELGALDLLIQVKSAGFNPVDYKIRSFRDADSKNLGVLGWDASGVVEKIGDHVTGFKVGDAVFYAGDLNRPGAYAEYQAVDSRLVSVMPRSLDYAQAAAIPLTAITAYEALILQRTTQYTAATKVLVIGGAGGVGSMAIQLLKQLTPATVIASASRRESAEWCKSLGADHLLDHSNDLQEELRKIGLEDVDFVFCTTQSDQYYDVFQKIIRPFGHLCLIDDPDTFELSPFKLKSISVNFEFMFTRSMFDHEPEVQGRALTHVAQLIDEKKIRTTLNRKFKGLIPNNVLEAHSLLESGKSIGKMVMEF